MARTGLYKSEVEKARNSLIALGRHPSVDAVRIALGNTGSKTTIHKYLKELEEENGGNVDRKTTISEALQDLVARLAVQLEAETNNRVAELESRHSEKDHLHEAEIGALTAKSAAIQEKLDLTIAAIKHEIQSHEQTREALQSESIARHTLAQQVTDLKDRLEENEKHRQSLEEKHNHVRDALEHYRSSVKEQRDQDIRRHEQQVQQLQAELRHLQQSLMLKQNEVTQLNQDGARLVAELSQAQKSLYEEKNQSRKTQNDLEAQRAIAQRAAQLEAQLIKEGVRVANLQEQHADALAKNKALDTQINSLQLELATTSAKLEAQQHVMDEFKTLLNAKTH
ncbi:DNA-binding protein [Undibacterium pigrum]|uniref:Plasmid replication DNA-binding protein KfrA n=1 Tax=Undibacterium pigrum TaxID=401470 RepID=A0A318JII6_9BURK|nr:DNA-binding protein [Undibacterium pigrum]PXX47042.1 plasmid replication DNA-binding protein KfrA [Undibacterium pigrum]